MATSSVWPTLRDATLRAAPQGEETFIGKWKQAVLQLGETGMGYVVVSITLTDGRKFDHAIIDSGYLNRVRGIPDVPFTENDIAEIKQTDAKWDWTETQ
jgi:hypothetical protein